MGEGAGRDAPAGTSLRAQSRGRRPPIKSSIKDGAWSLARFALGSLDTRESETETSRCIRADPWRGSLPGVRARLRLRCGGRRGGRRRRRGHRACGCAGVLPLPAPVPALRPLARARTARAPRYFIYTVTPDRAHRAWHRTELGWRWGVGGGLGVSRSVSRVAVRRCQLESEQHERKARRRGGGFQDQVS